MSMYRRFLLKREFWAVPEKDGREPSRYIKHDVKVGGIYAELSNKGVTISVNGESRFFNNFLDLDQYLDQLPLNFRESNSEFFQILNRRTTARVLRHIPI